MKKTLKTQTTTTKAEPYKPSYQIIKGHYVDFKVGHVVGKTREKHIPEKMLFAVICTILVFKIFSFGVAVSLCLSTAVYLVLKIAQLKTFAVQDREVSAIREEIARIKQQEITMLKKQEKKEQRELKTAIKKQQEAAVMTSTQTQRTVTSRSSSDAIKPPTPKQLDYCDFLIGTTGIQPENECYEDFRAMWAWIRFAESGLDDELKRAFWKKSEDKDKSAATKTTSAYEPGVRKLNIEPEPVQRSTAKEEDDRFPPPHLDEPYIPSHIADGFDNEFDASFYQH